jgi:hypothetical protein
MYATLVGMLMTGFVGMDSKFYDQLKIYRLGSGETASPSKGFKVVTFEDPFSGDVFAANTLDCEFKPTPVGCHWSDYGNMVSESGGAMLIERGNIWRKSLEESYTKFMANYNEMSGSDYDQKTEAYNVYMDLLYEYWMAKYQVEYVIRDINWVRGVYDFFGTLF